MTVVSRAARWAWTALGVWSHSAWEKGTLPIRLSIGMDALMIPTHPEKGNFDAGIFRLMEG
jgi:hypothetical protein